MSKKSTADADGHPTYSHRHKYSDPSHHVGPSTVAMRQGRAAHPHRKSGEKFTPAVERRIERRYAAQFRRKGLTPKHAEEKARYVAWAVVGSVTAARRTRRRR